MAQLNPELQAIIFDLDGTLLDWSGFSAEWDDMRREQLQPVHVHLSESGHKLPEYDRFLQDIAQYSEAMWERSRNGNLDAPGMGDALRDALTGYGLDVAAIDIDAVLDHYTWGQAPGTQLYPGVRSLLNQLREAGLQVGLLTNAFFPMWMRDKELRDLDIIDCFDCRFSACDVGKLKPHPLPFHRTLECVGATAESAVFVGDSLAADITGANGVGMRSVWHKIEDKQQPDEKSTPDATIYTPQELVAVLDDWYPGWRNGK